MTNVFKIGFCIGKAPVKANDIDIYMFREVSNLPPD